MEPARARARRKAPAPVGARGRVARAHFPRDPDVAIAQVGAHGLARGHTPDGIPTAIAMGTTVCNEAYPQFVRGLIGWLRRALPYNELSNNSTSSSATSRRSSGAASILVLSTQKRAPATFNLPSQF